MMNRPERPSQLEHVSRIAMGIIDFPTSIESAVSSDTRAFSRLKILVDYYKTPNFSGP